MKGLMYKTRQIVRHDFPVELPYCMYKLKNIQKNDGMVDGGDHVPKATRKTDIFEQNNVEIPGMAELEAKQEDILKQLADLKQQILAIKSNLKIVENSPKKCSLSSTQTCLAPIKANTNYTDIVINADPTTPPYSLRLIQKLLKDDVNFSFNFHIHSSVQTFRENTKNFQESLQNFVGNADAPKLHVTLIWKNVGVNAQLLVSQFPILGEVNLLRYLMRTVTSNTISNDAYDVEINSLLDLAYLITNATSETKRKLLLQNVNEALGKSEWLLGRKSISMADVALYSAIKQSVNNRNVSVNLTNWYKKCENVFC